MEPPCLFASHAPKEATSSPYPSASSSFGRTKLHQPRAAKIDPIALRPVRDTNQGFAAAWAADDRAHRRGVDDGRADRTDSVAVGADDFSRGHLERKDLAEDTTRSVAVEVLFVIGHAVPPVA